MHVCVVGCDGVMVCVVCVVCMYMCACVYQGVGMWWGVSVPVYTWCVGTFVGARRPRAGKDHREGT